MAATSPIPSHRLKCESSGCSHDSKLSSFGRALLPWLGISANAAMSQSLSLILKDIAEPATKKIAVQQKSLDSLTKVVLDNKTAVGYLLADWGVCAVATTTCCTWADTSGVAETWLHKITKKPVGLRKWLLQSSLSLICWILTGLLGTMAPNWTSDVGNYPAYNNHRSPWRTIFSQKL